MGFEYDPEKSRANKDKHGIDFKDAQQLWTDELMVVAPARTDEESRFIAIGRIAGKHWSAIYTQRGGNIRIISVRRSREAEVDFYEGT